MRNLRSLLVLAITAAVFVSCSDDDDNPAPVNPGELITDVEVVFTNAADGNDVVTLTAVSADGIEDPTLTVSGPFTANATYNATVTILDEVNDENILEEVVEEVDEHFFVYIANPGTLFTAMTRDADDPEGELEDGTQFRLGLETTWTTGAAGAGTLTVQLVHEATSVDDSNGYGTASGGEFDIDNTFDIVIQ